jgi:outer membrane protein assembly factor BamA
VVPGALGQQSDGAQSLRLERLEFEGLKRYGQDQIVEASELKIGQTVNEDLLDQAANRLVQTGFLQT